MQFENAQQIRHRSLLTKVEQVHLFHFLPA
jgi:hypothetical protein